jgi:hypothetical protein
MNELTQIFNDSITDKACDHSYEHLYAILAPAILGVEYPDLNILELGVQAGGGLRVLHSLFPTASLYGIDINLIAGDVNATLVWGNLADRDDTERLYRLLSDLHFALIIDDASHVLGDQLLSVEILFPLLAPGGIYVIEDIQAPDHLPWFKHLPGFMVVDLRLISKRDSICVVVRQQGTRTVWRPCPKIERSEIR